MYNSSVYIPYGSIVPETIAGPSSAAKTSAVITITIVDAAIEANFWPPITGMENVNTTIETPIARSPVYSKAWWSHPHTWNPIIIALIGVPGPITRLPYIAINGTRRLNIHGQWRRRYRRLDANTHAYLGLRLSGSH
jgi:hypothetical protein